MKRGTVVAASVVFCMLLLLIFSTEPGTTATSQQTFTGQENHTISLQDAAVLTRRYRQSVTTGSVLGGYFGENALQGVMAQQGCVGIRAYLARNADGSPTLVLVGVDNGGNDLTQGMLLETWFPCPPVCAPANDLNR